MFCFYDILLSDTFTLSSFATGITGVSIFTNAISAIFYNMSVFKLAAISIFMNKKVKNNKNIFDKKTFVASISTIISIIL